MKRGRKHVAYAPRAATAERLRDRDGNVWLVVNTVFVEDADSGERYTRAYIEKNRGPLTPIETTGAAQ